MRFPSWLCLLLPLVAGCSFGDNLVAPHGGSGSGTPTQICGDGIVEPPEACDDGNTVSGDGCSSTCQKESVCGNGIVEPGEECDDGNTVSGDGCSSTCQIEPASACALVPQAGCTDAAEPACDLDAADDGATACRAVTKQGTANDHCAAQTDCKAGYTCVHEGSDSADNSECARFCASDAACPGVGSRCVVALTDASGAPINVDVCSNACDPFAQTGCPSDMGCIGHVATAGDFTDCAVMTGLPDGAACTASIDCTPGAACVTDGATSVCEPYCIVGDDDSCDAGTCVGFSEPLVIGSDEFGACQ